MQNGAQTLTVSDVTIDASAGDSAGGKNTDCFDIGRSMLVSFLCAQTAAITSRC